MVDDEAIDKVQSQFLPDEVPKTQNENLQNKKPELEEIESQDMAPVESTTSVDENVIPMLDLSATDEIGIQDTTKAFGKGTKLHNQEIECKRS
ncbi:hypothetical protein P8452_16823 [Trifolium repens]|nr:hypothetical protein P8452_16823 [Trifolium repens]